ncbi:SMP-30/gluconolactonase/LRE family protein [Nocardia neocaledoniensis]|uniref:SMP-30/gluconolactonase/LRE family protein n=1 Tax=Nocardia neocaledoniensis TaxID=236511 RepID=UPI00245885CD|nr:SMP-30/gluconolactonase/LRE family protein [Nocardia neocaledoniensis]
MTRRLVAEPITGAVAGHGEGPVWHPHFAGIRWVDMLAGDILELSEEKVRRTRVGKVAAAFRPRASGGLVLADERGFLLLDPDLTIERRLGDLWDDPGIRMNDGGCLPDGAFLCGSMAYDERPGAGALYRLAPDLTVQRVLDDVTISNGLATDPAGHHMYYVDTPTGRIDVLDLVDDLPRNRRPAIQTTGGCPDGLTVDAVGGIWVALWGGSAVHRYTPTGELDTIVELPVPQVTACTFGSASLDRLYITTSTQGLDPSEYPLAGALFAVDCGVGGMPAAEFAS